MAVEPLERERVAADGLEVLDLELVVAGLDEPDLARVALAAGAGAVAAQDDVRVDALVAVGPVDLGRARAAGRADGERLEAGVFAHGAILVIQRDSINVMLEVRGTAAD